MIGVQQSRGWQHYGTRPLICAARADGAARRAREPSARSAHAPRHCARADASDRPGLHPNPFTPPAAARHSRSHPPPGAPHHALQAPAQLRAAAAGQGGARRLSVPSSLHSHGDELARPRTVGGGNGRPSHVCAARAMPGGGMPRPRARAQAAAPRCLHTAAKRSHTALPPVPPCRMHASWPGGRNSCTLCPRASRQAHAPARARKESTRARRKHARALLPHPTTTHTHIPSNTHTHTHTQPPPPDQTRKGLINVRVTSVAGSARVRWPARRLSRCPFRERRLSLAHATPAWGAPR